MRVLVPGRAQHGWAAEVKCEGVPYDLGPGIKITQNGGCGAKLLVEQNDIYLMSEKCHSDVIAYVAFRCPSCGVISFVRGDLPFHPPRGPGINGAPPERPAAEEKEYAALGRVAYEAYGRSVGWSTMTGVPMPEWLAQLAHLQKAWCSSADAVRIAIEERDRPGRLARVRESIAQLEEESRRNSAKYDTPA